MRPVIVPFIHHNPSQRSDKANMCGCGDELTSSNFNQSKALWRIYGLVYESVPLQVEGLSSVIP